MDLGLIRRTWNLFKDFHKYFYISLAVLLFQEVLGTLPGLLWGKATDVLAKRGEEGKEELIQAFIVLNLSVYGIRVLTKIVEDLRDRFEKRTMDFAVPLFARMKVLNHLACELPLGVLRAQHSGQAQGVIETGEANTSSFMHTMLFRACPAIMGIAVTSGVMFWMDWKFGLVSVAGAAAMSGIIFLTNRHFRKRQHEINERRNRIIRFFSDTLRHAALLRIFSREKETVHEVETESVALNLERKSVITQKRTLSRISWLAVYSANCIIYHLSGKYIIGGSMTIGGMVMFMSWASIMQNYIQDLTNLDSEWSEILPSIRKYFGILDLAESMPKVCGAQDAREGRISFENVNFFYPKYRTLEDDLKKAKKEEKPAKLVLRDITISFPQGKTTAIVGRTGSGKSTLFSLLSGSYMPSEGRITFDGTSLKDIAPGSIHRLVGYVPQITELFDMSIGWHCRLGNPNISDEQILQAAQDVDMKEVILDLPEKLETRLGEGGKKLSGGQRQRIALMMALIKKPKVLLLDEPTSSLDYHTEEIVQRVVAKWKKETGGTLIVIAHHIDTVINADQIIVLEAGKVVGVGSHEGLLRNCEEYRLLNSKKSLAV